MKAIFIFFRIAENLNSVLLDNTNNTPDDLSSPLNLATALSVARQKITLARTRLNKSTKLTELTDTLKSAYFKYVGNEEKRREYIFFLIEITRK